MKSGRFNALMRSLFVLLAYLACIIVFISAMNSSLISTAWVVLLIGGFIIFVSASEYFEKRIFRKGDYVYLHNCLGEYKLVGLIQAVSYKDDCIKIEVFSDIGSIYIHSDTQGNITSTKGGFIVKI